MVLGASPMLEYTRATGTQLQAPEAYVEQVRATLPQGRIP